MICVDRLGLAGSCVGQGLNVRQQLVATGTGMLTSRDARMVRRGKRRVW